MHPGRETNLIFAGGWPDEMRSFIVPELAVAVSDGERSSAVVEEEGGGTGAAEISGRPVGESRAMNGRAEPEPEEGEGDVEGWAVTSLGVPGPDSVTAEDLQYCALPPFFPPLPPFLPRPFLLAGAPAGGLQS